jgi:hypothetical protein
MPWRGGIAVVRSFAGSFDAVTSTIQEIRVMLEATDISGGLFLKRKTEFMMI